MAFDHLDQLRAEKHWPQYQTTSSARAKKLIEVTKVESLTSLAPSPPAIIPQTLPIPSMTAEPESLRAENERDFEFLGNTHPSFDILPGWPSFEYILTSARMLFRGPIHGEVERASVLHDHNIVVVQVGWFEYLLVRNDATERKKTVPG